MPATYLRNGRGRSVNASIAEGENKLPLTRAVKALSQIARITQRRARAIFTEIGRCEWHHVGRYATACDYYSINQALHYLSLEPLRSRLPADWIERYSEGLDSLDINARLAARDHNAAAIAAACACMPTDLEVLYYGTYDEDFSDARLPQIVD